MAFFILCLNLIFSIYLCFIHKLFVSLQHQKQTSMRKLVYLSAVIIAAAFIGCSMSVSNEERMTEYNNRTMQLFDYLKDKDKISFLLDSIKDKFGTQFDFVGEFPTFLHTDSFDNIKVKTYLYLREDTLMQMMMLVQTEDKNQFKTMTKLYESTELFYQQFELYNDSSMAKSYIVNNDCFQLLPFDSDDNYIGFGVNVLRFQPEVWKKEREEHERLEKELNEMDKSENNLARNLGLIH